ncbi:hypothetical protein Tco_1128372 [Tanacetum coccineum]
MIFAERSVSGYLGTLRNLGYLGFVALLLCSSYCMYTRFIEFANYRVPLSKFLLCILEYYHIYLSQLSTIDAAKIDASVCLLSTSWFSGTSVVKDPLPVDEAVDLPCVELLNENCTLIRKYPETFLCFVGLSRSLLILMSAPLCCIIMMRVEIDLLDFVKSANPFKVKVGERTLAENEVPLIPETEDMVISLAEQTISLVDHTIQDELNVNSGKQKKKVAFVSRSPPVKKARAGGIVISDSWPSMAGKSPSALQRLSRQNEQADTGSGSAALATEDVTSSSITPTLSVFLKMFLMIIHGSSADDFYKSQTIDSASALNVYVPNWNVTNNARIDNPTICQNLLDHVTPPGYRAALRNQHDVAFLDAVNINSAQHQRDAEIADMKARLEKSEAKAAEVIELRKRVSDLEATVAIKVGELASFHTENVGLVERVSALESKRDRLKNQVVGEGKMREEIVSQQDAAERRFTERAVELDAYIADVRRNMDNDLYPHMLTAIAGRRWVVGHGFRLAVYKCAHSVECRSALGKVISMAINKGIQQGLRDGIVHGKAGRSLAQVEAYDPEVEGKYVATVSDFEGVSFPLLDELESLKDSPLGLIMSALILKDDHGNRDVAPEFAQFQPSIDQVTVPVYSESSSVDREMLLFDVIHVIRQSVERRGLCPPSRSTLGEASGSAPPPDSSLGVVDYQVSTLVLASDGGSADQTSTAPPHDDLFDTSILDKPGDS